MAKLLVINDESKFNGENFIGDIISIYEDNQELGIKEARLVQEGIFKIETINGKTADKIREEIRVAQPEIKEMWLDKKTGEWKELIKKPQAQFAYKNNTFVSNIDKDLNNKVVNKK